MQTHTTFHKRVMCWRHCLQLVESVNHWEIIGPKGLDVITRYNQWWIHNLMALLRIIEIFEDQQKCWGNRSTRPRSWWKYTVSGLFISAFSGWHEIICPIHKDLLPSYSALPQVQSNGVSFPWVEIMVQNKSFPLNCFSNIFATTANTWTYFTNVIFVVTSTRRLSFFLYFLFFLFSLFLRQSFSV